MVLRLRHPLVPLGTPSHGLGQPLLRHHRLQVLLPLKDLQRQATRSVPRNMAVEKPRSRVICLERNDHISPRGQKNDVAARGVIEFEFYASRLLEVVEVISLRQQGKVVSVQVHRVRDGEEASVGAIGDSREPRRARDNKVHPRVGIALLGDDDVVVLPRCGV